MEFKAASITADSTATDQSIGISDGDLPATVTRVELRVELQRLALSLALDGIADSPHGPRQSGTPRIDGQLPTPLPEKTAHPSGGRDMIFSTRSSDASAPSTIENLGGVRDSIDRAVDLKQLGHREVTREQRSPNVKQREAPEEARPERAISKERGEHNPAERSQAKEQKETPPIHKHAPKEPTTAPVVPKPSEVIQEPIQAPSRTTTQEPTREPATTQITAGPQQPPTIEATRAQLSPAISLENARIAVFDKINTLREVVQIAPVIAETRGPTFSLSYSESKPNEPVAHNSASRTSEQLRPSEPRREVSTPSITPSPLTVVDKTVAPQQTADSTNRSTTPAQEQQRAIQLLDGLEKITSQLMSMTTLRAMDRALETVCLSVVAGGFLGAQGATYIVRETLTATNDIIARIRDMMGIPTTLSKELCTVQESLNQLEKQCLDRDFEKVDSAAGFVSDITGRILLSGSGLPVEGITVDGGSLGTCITNSFGEFHFDNIPLDTGYEITAHDASYLFFPSSFVGTVATANQLIFSATKVS